MSDPMHVLEEYATRWRAEQVPPIVDWSLVTNPSPRQHRWPAMTAAAACLVLVVTATVVGVRHWTSEGDRRNGVPGSVTAAPTARAFVSVVYPYRLVLTDGWFSHFARRTWNSTTLFSNDAPFLDYYRDGTHQVFVGAAKLSARPSLQQWRETVRAATPSQCVSSGPVERSSLDQEPAFLWSESCGAEAAVIKMAALHHGRGYVFGLLAPTGAGVNRQLFDAARQGFHFTG